MGAQRGGQRSGVEWEGGRRGGDCVTTGRYEAWTSTVRGLQELRWRMAVWMREG